MSKWCLFLALMAVSLMGSGQSLLAAKETGKKWGYVDTVGTYVIQPLFDSANPFNGDYAVVQSGKKWGVIKKTGEFVIAPQYDDAHAIVNEGKATVKMGKYWGVVDLKGATVVPFQHEYLSIFNEGYIVTGRIIKTPGAAYNVDVSILNGNGQVMLDFGSYKLPGKVSNTGDWELGNYPMVHDGWILLYYDHSFDIDPIKRLNPAYNYILGHHVQSGMPNAEPIVTLGKTQKLTYLPEYREGLLAVGYDPTSANYSELWNPLKTYNSYDRVFYEGKNFQIIEGRPSRNNPPSTSPGYWSVDTLVSNDVPHCVILTTILYERIKVHQRFGALSPWEPTNDYIVMDKVQVDGRVYEATEDNRNKNPKKEYDVWQSLGPAVDTVGANYYANVARSGVRAEKLYPTFDGKILSVFSDRIFLADAQGWTFPTRIVLSNKSLVGNKPVIANGLLQLADKTSGKQGYIDIHGVTKIPFTLEESFPFFERVAVAKQDGKYGLLRRDGGWVIKPRFEQLASAIDFRAY